MPSTSLKLIFSPAVLLLAIFYLSFPLSAQAQQTQPTNPYAVSNAEGQYLGQPGQPTTYQQGTYQGSYQQMPSQTVQQTTVVSQPSTYGAQPYQKPYQQKLVYQYDPNNASDPRNQPAGSPGQQVSTLTLGTLQGVDLGIQFSHYDYEEPGLDHQTGNKIGFEGGGTYIFLPGYFVTADVRYAFGDNDYNGNASGSGTRNNLDDELWDVRGLIGADYVWQNTFAVSPYSGFGYRHLYNDARGVTSTGANGYQRYNDLYYIPLGVRPRVRVDSTDRIAAMLEYDYLIHGQQTSDFSDIAAGDPNITTQQNGGYGLRGELMWETGSWSAGPYFNYWNIQQSTSKTFKDSVGNLCNGTPGPETCVGTEPANNTTEFGIQARYHFF